ncbi:DoxX family protein [Pseudooctadecabacter jejudonensis]|uniref:Inner membrane protein YqjF n=1 Tax=Pseudooctadecabacter jejudonensis TaxID=1391910 RepID=A0A1Y5R9V1_9RHOB|nr:DoxX family protein [Pseudooctadecabacter jejudonensis]SLN12161.1 Inner membrane protein YqjF [Pseudooctadecabacter jejudonensis]
MKNRIDDAVLLAARALLALLFLGGAVQKSIDPHPAIDLLAQWGLPSFLVWPALVLNGVVGFGLLLGWQVRAMAFGAAVYCAVTSLFHVQPEDPWQMTIFVKNWAIAGGCLALAVAGGGRWALQVPSRPLD